MPEQKAHRPVTLNDVAKAAGVSTITASRALSNPDLVSPAAIDRVRRAADQMGYVPNLLAGGLKSRRSMTVGAIVPVISVPQFLPTVQSLTEELDLAGYQVILGQARYDNARETALVETMVGRRVDAIVVCGLLRSQDAVRRLAALKIPVVETWDLSDRPLDMLVGFSHERVGAAVAAFFRAKGWDRVGIATADDERAMRRRQGFLIAVGRDVPTAVIKAPSNMALGRHALSELLRQAPDVRAVFCSSDGLAQGVLAEAQVRGLRVPHDLAVVGFGDADFAAHVVPPLTTVRIDGARIGRLAAELVIARCQGETIDRRLVEVAFSIVERESTTG